MGRVRFKRKSILSQTQRTYPLTSTIIHTWLIVFICATFSNLKKDFFNHKIIYVKRIISNSNYRIFKLQWIIKQNRSSSFVKAASPSLCFVPQPEMQRPLPDRYRERRELKPRRCDCVPCHCSLPVAHEEPRAPRIRLFQESFQPLFDNVLCLLVLWHCCVLKSRVLYAEFVTPGIWCSDGHQPGHVT